MTEGWHAGRSWSGHPLEDECPCPKVACGLIDIDTVDLACPQHGIGHAKTLRQMHPAANCPATAYEEMLGADRPLAERRADFERIAAVAPVIRREARP